MLISANGWLCFPKPNKEATLRLFCFPGIGSGTTLFSSWPPLLPKSVEVCAAMLHGATSDLIGTTPPTFSSVVASIAEDIQQYMDHPFAFFAHSLGAVIAFEVARYLSHHAPSQPIHLFFAGFPPLHLPRHLLPAINLPERDAIALLLPAIAKASPITQLPGAKRKMEAQISLDIAITQAYCYQHDAPFSCPITAFAGEQDQFVDAQLYPAWAEQTASSFSLKTFAGDHFFFYQDPLPMLEAIVQDLPLIQKLSA